MLIVLIDRGRPFILLTRFLSVLDGYENLSRKDGATITLDSDTNDIPELHDLNLETVLTSCTVGSACSVVVNLADQPSGIYKVMLYASSAESSIEGWEVGARCNT